MAESPTPPVVPSELAPRPDKSTFGKVRYSKPRVSASTIAEAMITTRGDRTAACQILRMKSSHLANRIQSNPELKARFGRKAVELRNKLQIDMLEAAGQRTPETVDVISKQLEELVVGQAQIAQFAMNRLVEIRDRIKKGNEAKLLQGMPVEMLTPDEQKFIYKHAFVINDNQDEEKKLFDQEQAMMQEYSRANISCSAVGFTKAKADVMMQKIRPPGNRGKPASAPPKGSPSVAISGSQVIIQNSPAPIAEIKGA